MTTVVRSKQENMAWRRACEDKFKHLMKKMPQSNGKHKYVYECDVCSKKLHSAGMMDRHMRSTHSQVWK